MENTVKEFNLNITIIEKLNNGLIKIMNNSRNDVKLNVDLNVNKEKIPGVGGIRKTRKKPRKKKVKTKK